MRQLRQCVLLLLCAAYALAAVAADGVLQQARQSLENGNARQAYDLLVPLQASRAGEPEYDYLLGTSALELGKNTEAVFALERVLAVQPNNAAARAQIARAYYNLKEMQTAKREFENVKKQDVPPAVSATIDRFLDAITRGEETDRTVIRGFVEFALGYDTNVNSATANNQVAIPAFAGVIFTLAPTATEQGDEFFSFGGGLGIQHPVSKRLAVFGGLAYQNKTNFSQDDYSTYYYDANLGLSYRFDRDTFTLAGQYNSFWVDNRQLYSDAYRKAAGATAQWQHDFDARNQVSVFLQYSELTYPGQQIRDANRYVGGAGYAHAFGRGAVITYTGLYVGAEIEKADSVPQFGHDLYGVRLGSQWNINEKFALFASASGERREYGGPDPLFLVDRKDTQYSASGGLIYVPRRNVRVTPQISWTDNRSNVGIYEFDRIIYQVTFRHDM